MIYHDPHLTGSILLGNNAGVSGSLDVAGPGGGGLDAVFGNIGVQSVTDTNSFIGFNSYYDGSSPRARRDGHSAWIQVANGRFFFRNSPYTGSNQITENNVQLLIDTSGSVGIGTTSPQQKLHVDGTMRLEKDNQSTTWIDWATLGGGVGFGISGSKGWRLYGVGNSVGSTSNYMQLLSFDGVAGSLVYQIDPLGSFEMWHPFKMESNINLNGNWLSGDGDNEGLYIDTSGKVGIGTSSPTTMLDIEGADPLIEINNTSYTKRWQLGSSGGSSFFVYDPDNAKIPFLIQDNSPANAFRIHSNGNIGIGTTGPSEKLHVQNGSIRIKATDQTNRVMQFENDSGSKFEIMSVRSNSGGSRANDFRIYSYDATKDFIVENFNAFGVGTDGPQEKLDVVGNARIRSIGSGTSAGALHYESDGTLTTNTSDRRLKRDINYISGSHYLDKVLALSPVTFKWKLNDKIARDDQEIVLREQEVSGSLVSGSLLESTRERVKNLRRINKGRRDNCQRLQYGLIAQDVRQHIPEAVGRLDNGNLFLRNEQISSLLISALKEQQLIIEDLKSRIEVLESN